MKAKDEEINYLKHQKERDAWELTQAQLDLARENSNLKDDFIKNLSLQVENLNRRVAELIEQLNDREMTNPHIIATYENRLEGLDLQAVLPSQTDSSLLYI